ncbi:MAG: hypothetical protein H6741_01160 [Alphaproteobacteria bacterium]|nr:hypothetical protein [Alphaproteobacteria bacterium]MCB9791308.1 hypothetical protein [Alphaproteobacteria bacterium]
MDDKHDEFDDDSPTEIIHRGDLEAARNLKEPQDDEEPDEEEDAPTG